MFNRSHVYMARERVPFINNSNSEEMSAYVKIYMMLPNFEVVSTRLRGRDKVKKREVIPMR